MFVTMNVLFYIQSGNLRDPKVEVKEEIKEEDDEDGVMEEEHTIPHHHQLDEEQLLVVMIYTQHVYYNECFILYSEWKPRG